MRYSQYKTINELSESLNEALVYVADRKNYALLEDCLMAMTAISDVLLNESGKEADKAKCILADMYKILEILDNPEDDIPKIANLSGDLANECKTNLKYKLRILFVAELGSKWDSMKSVYEAFLERDDCDIDVVLEPIFRATQLPNGETKAEIIYDDWLTPLGINHIPYKQYDMATIQPDITFISQPYESVTVPMFWPENIAKYSKLVYLPYYMSMPLKIGSEFLSILQMPVERYSWRIVAQSVYMKEYYKKFGFNRGENVIVTGLPKWDFPIALNSKNTQCPVEWKKKIKNRKVFLYTTHFGDDIIPFNSKAFSVINYFLIHPEYALIWRPHPMTETIKKLYQHEQWMNYEELKEAIHKSPNIIIDDNPSYDISFVWSDALLSEYTSMISQYLLMRKPIICVCKRREDEETNLFDYGKLTFVTDEESLERHLHLVVFDDSSFMKSVNDTVGQFFFNADGKIGKRVADIIVQEFLVTDK